MVNLGYLSASIVALVTFATHFVVGGVFAAHPLLERRDLPRTSKWLNYYCWHMVSILLVAMIVVFALASFRADLDSLALGFTGLSAAFSILCIAVARTGGLSPFRVPATILFAVLCACGAWGYFTSP
jgi:hypothetical protein